MAGDVWTCGENLSAFSGGAYKEESLPFQGRLESYKGYLVRASTARPKTRPHGVIELTNDIFEQPVHKRYEWVYKCLPPGGRGSATAVDGARVFCVWSDSAMHCGRRAVAPALHSHTLPRPPAETAPSRWELGRGAAYSCGGGLYKTPPSVSIVGATVGRPCSSSPAFAAIRMHRCSLLPPSVFVGTRVRHRPHSSVPVS